MPVGMPYLREASIIPASHTAAGAAASDIEAAARSSVAASAGRALPVTRSLMVLSPLRAAKAPFARARAIAVLAGEAARLVAHLGIRAAAGIALLHRHAVDVEAHAAQSLHDLVAVGR